jgi:hypothetical protein
MLSGVCLRKAVAGKPVAGTGTDATGKAEYKETRPTGELGNWCDHAEYQARFWLTRHETNEINPLKSKEHDRIHDPFNLD